MSERMIIIAECGVNHNGNPDFAKEMIDIASESGADFVKFQTYKVDGLIKKDCPMADYQFLNLKENKSQYEMLKQYELSEDVFHDLYDYSKKRDIQFLSTPFDMESLFFLISLGLKTIKISSGDLTNAPLLFEAARNGVQIILSTGMAQIEEISAAIATLYWGYNNAKETPQSFQEILDYLPQDFYKSLYEKVSLLHCLSDYPAPMEHVNLRALKTLEERYSLKVGYSDHTLGIHIPIAAVALGARIIEKHFTLDRSLPGPDHKASLTPNELKKMVNDIRDIEKAMGDGIKKPRGNEEETARLVRKGLYARNFIAQNQVIKAEDIICLRPVSNHSPWLYWDYLNKKAQKNYNPGDPL